MRTWPSPTWKFVVVVFASISVFYVMIGGLLGVAAATRTLPTFGIGMGFKAKRANESVAMRPYLLAEALACQERMNQIRVIRNEAAFMSIRNGFLFVLIAVLAVLIGVQFTNKDDAIERKIWPASTHAI